jgi:hypothetical protein
MATGNMIPYSNPAGNNQTTPSSGVASTINKTAVLPGAAGTVTAPLSTNANPLVPAAVTPSSVTGVPATAPGVVASALNTPELAMLQPQLDDIYGAEGDALSSLLTNIGGTNSQSLQEFIQGLGPQEATAQANLNSTLGASGVGINSSVAAIGDANLQAQEFSTVSQEAASLTQSGQSMEEQILMGIAPAAATETAQKAEEPWAIGSAMASMIPEVGGAISEGLKAQGGAAAATSSGSSSSGIMGMSSFDSSGSNYGSVPMMPESMTENNGFY